MAFDAAFMRAVAKEIREGALGYRIDKIYQPGKDEIIFILRGYKDTKRLLFSAGSERQRVSFTESERENPPAAPNFCMFLRKHLTGFKLERIEQPGLERVLIFFFSGYDDFNEPVEKRFVIEIMGRYSNLLLVGPDERILAALRSIDFEQNSSRQILPGLFYTLPAPLAKKSPLQATTKEIEEALFSAPGERRADKVILDVFLGISPLICREIAHRAGISPDAALGALSPSAKSRLIFQAERMFKAIREENFTPTMLLYAKDQKPYEFSFTEIGQYGALMLEKPIASFSALLGEFYGRRDREEKIQQRSKEILRIIVNSIERVSKKMNLQMKELEDAGKKDELRVTADLINANLYQIKEGDRVLKCVDFYDPEGKTVEIPLDSSLTGAQNAQRRYKAYTRAKSTESHLKIQIEKGKEELSYLESVFQNLALSETESDVNEIKDELSEGGYYARKAQKRGRARPSKPGFMEFSLRGGFLALAGKNNRQNDELTLKIAQRGDIWCHARNMPGCHLVIFSRGEKVPKEVIEEGCMLAALYSKGKDSSNVPVDFTEIRNVKKPPRAKPGMVIYKNFETAYVTPDEKKADLLRKK